jgi:hypothetical protein
MKGACSQNVIVGNKTCTAGVVCVVGKEGVCLESRSGDFVPALRYVIPGRGLHQNHGQCGTFRPPSRTPLGEALLVSCRPRDRVGFRGSAGEHAGYQRQWHVHRSGGPAMDWRGVHRAFEPPPAADGRLLREANRTGTGHGRFRGACRIRKSENLPRTSFHTLLRRRLRANYTKVENCLISFWLGEE